MTIRNLLLATTTPPPTDALKFPIYLVDGDNGQLGIDLYNWLETNLDDWNSDTQKIYIIGERVYGIKYSYMYLAYELTKPGSPWILHDNGFIEQAIYSGGSSD